MSAGAFHGDAALRRALLDTIDRHVAADTLVFDGTVWDGKRGSAMGIAIEAADPALYADRYGFPLPLATLLDELMLGIADRDAAVRYVRGWVEAAIPGADLGAVPGRLMLRMLASPEPLGVDDDLAARIAALHARDIDGSPASRAAWSLLRRDILDRAPPLAETVPSAVFELWEACSWPARRGRSILVLALRKWATLRARAATGDWSEGDAARARAVLEALWAEQAAARDAGIDADYHALFLARDPVLAAGFTAHLDRTNARYLESWGIMADWCMADLAAAAPAAA